MSTERLNVVALVSGGKDSFYSVLHCLHHGHRIVALANLYPVGEGDQSSEIQVITPDRPVSLFLHSPDPRSSTSTEQDLNSFMYQTVGHQVIPLYAQATGLPLYRRPIVGNAVRHERDYDCTSTEASSRLVEDETESMLPLLKLIKDRHPEANAVCSGAILSSYQRTRVESVAIRLGLTPLSYLWQYPSLPSPSGDSVDEAQLLMDMADAGLEARIVKVASAGLDETHLWQRVSSEAGVSRIKASLRKFGAAQGASLGEGGEFETLVVDGPSPLFKKRIRVPINRRVVISEGGGSTWLMIREGHLEDKPDYAEGEAKLLIREPGLLDARFHAMSDSLPRSTHARTRDGLFETSKLITASLPTQAPVNAAGLRWAVVAESHTPALPVRDEAVVILQKIRSLLSSNALVPEQITCVTILLRTISDFAQINEEYGKLFARPNPPSRVTVCCGHLLPEGRNIVMYITLAAANVDNTRDGLHVQSRSYWAPANIGPYSQAIVTAVTMGERPTGLRTVLVAGQIPLIPASMTLPCPPKDSLQGQAVLSLQHLWRIGSATKVQCWTSAVAYLARRASESAAQDGARLVGAAWTLAHGSPDDDEETEGPDPWDLKYNPQYQSLSGGQMGRLRPSVPDWSVFTLSQQQAHRSCIPPVFAAEVESLPRQSLVEWHAHAGLTNIEDGCLELVHHGNLGGAGLWSGWHVVVKTKVACVVHSTIAYCRQGQSEMTTFQSLEQGLKSAIQEGLGRLQVGVDVSNCPQPYLGYVDMNETRGLWDAGGDGLGLATPFAAVPCHSLWSSAGERVGLVALYQIVITTFDK